MCPWLILGEPNFTPTNRAFGSPHPERMTHTGVLPRPAQNVSCGATAFSIGAPAPQISMAGSTRSFRYFFAVSRCKIDTCWQSTDGSCVLL